MAELFLCSNENKGMFLEDGILTLEKASKLLIALLELQIKCYLTVRNNSTGSGSRDFHGTVNESERRPLWRIMKK